MMLRNRTIRSSIASWGLACVVLAMVPVVACSSSSTAGPPDSGPDGASSVSSDGSTSDSRSDAGSVAASMCANPGEATPGPADDHCALPDGGTMVQTTSQASCMVSSLGDDGGDAASGDDGGGDLCDYGPTMYGYESDDDDCKYHVTWSSTPICEGAPGVVFTVTATHKTDGSPLTGANPGVEAFTTTPGDWDSAAYCDTMSTHPSGPPGGGFWPLTEGTSGTYTGPVQFDQAGQWTIRYHFYHECFDILPDSPHGHAAYHLTVP